MANKKTWILVVALVAVIGLAGSVIFLPVRAGAGSTRGGDPASEAARNEDLRGISSALNRLDRRLDVMEARVDGRGSDFPSTASAAPVPAASATETPRGYPVGDPVAAGVAANQARRVELDDRVASEPVDPGWARRYEADATAKLQARFPTAQILESRCKSTLCRFEIGTADIKGQRDFLEDYWHELPEYEVAHYYPTHPAAGEKPRVTVYVVRKGVQEE